MKKQALPLKILLLAIIASALVTCGNEGDLHEIPLFAEEFWGEWIRMDTGETWYFANNYRMIGNSYYTTTVNMTKESDNVIIVTEGTGVNAKQYFLYASRTRNSTFGASAVKDDGSRALFSRVVNVPKGTNAVVEAVKNGMDKQTVEIGDEGELEAENIIAGDDYIVTIDDHEFTVTPNTDGENVGTLTLTSGVNIKTSIVPQSYSTDLMRLFSGQPYDLTIKFTNIGETISTAMEYRLTLPAGLEITRNTNSTRLNAGDLQSIMPGKTREIDITVQCGAISEEFEFKDIVIDTEDFNGKKWTDSVSLKINKESVTFNIRSNLAINGIIIVPNGKAYYFKTSGSSSLYSAAVKVPKYLKDYLIVFSGASADTEAKYSFAVDKIPAVNFADYGINSLKQYWPNGTEGEAAEIDSNQEVMAYLLMNVANYYKVKFTE
ncbi:hypothetical protein [Treponema sp. R80B11-R83G3]